MSKKLVREMWNQIGKKDVVSISPTASVYEASCVQTENQVGALVVIDPDTGNFLGVLSERDIVRRVIAEKLDQFTTLVQEVMTSKVISVSPIANHDECKTLMNDSAVRHLPVVENGKVLGMVSMVDLIRSDEYDAKLDRDHMESYLSRSG